MLVMYEVDTFQPLCCNPAAHLAHHIYTVSQKKHPRCFSL